MTRRPRHGRAGHEREGRGAPHPRVGPQPPARRGRRASRGRGHAPRRARRPRGVSAPERALATVDLGAIERNCARLPKPLCAVVKADAYGHGPVAAAALAGGASWLAVAAADEAAELRRQGIDAPILVMGALTGGRAARGGGSATPTSWPGPRRSPRPRPRVHVKLDTGMGRLGTKDRELALRLAARPNVVGLMTHFATADEPGDDLFGAQLEAFREFVDDGWARRAASSTRPTAPPRCATRPATSTWCAAASPSTAWTRSARTRRAHGLEPALSLRSWVGAVRRFEAGDSAGYGRRWTARRADLGRHRADRLRRRLAARAHQQLRRADPRPPPSAGRDGQHGQRDGGARARHGRRGRRRGRADRRAGGGAHTGRGGGAPAGHDQLRGHLRAARRGCAASTCRDRAPGSSAARCATSCSAARCATSTSPSPATPRGPPGRSRRSCGGPCSGCRRRSAPGA